MIKRRVFDQAFKEMAIELSYVKGSIRKAARALDIDPGRISKWRQGYNKANQVSSAVNQLTDE